MPAVMGTSPSEGSKSWGQDTSVKQQHALFITAIFIILPKSQIQVISVDLQVSPSPAEVLTAPSPVPHYTKWRSWPRMPQQNFHWRDMSTSHHPHLLQINAPHRETHRHHGAKGHGPCHLCCLTKRIKKSPPQLPDNYVELGCSRQLMAPAAHTHTITQACT